MQTQKTNLFIGVVLLFMPAILQAANSPSFVLYDDQNNFAQYNFGDSTNFNMDDSGQTWELKPRTSTSFKIVSTPPATASSSSSSSAAPASSSQATSTDDNSATGGGRRPETLENYQNSSTNEPTHSAAPASSSSSMPVSSAPAPQSQASLQSSVASDSMSSASAEQPLPSDLLDIIRQIEPGDIVRSESGALVVTTGTGQQIIIITTPESTYEPTHCAPPAQIIVSATDYTPVYRILILLLLIFIAILLLLYREYRIVLAELHELEQTTKRSTSTSRRKKRA